MDLDVEDQEPQVGNHQPIHGTQRSIYCQLWQGRRGQHRFRHFVLFGNEYSFSTDIEQCFLTTGHLRALNTSNGRVACFPVHVHADTGGIALVVSINEESSETGMSLHRAQEG
jgi:hypothetical protein